MSDPGDFAEGDELAPPRWLLTIGVLLVVAMLAAAAFSIGVFVAERGLLG